MTSSSPKVATISPSHSPPDDRAWVDSGRPQEGRTSGSRPSPRRTPPSTWAVMYTAASRVVIPPKTRSARVTTGLKCASGHRPEGKDERRRGRRRWPSSSPAVAARCRPGERRWAAIPEPTTMAARKPCQRTRQWPCGPDRGATQQQRAADSGVSAQHTASWPRSRPHEPRTCRTCRCPRARCRSPTVAVGTVDPHLVLSGEAARTRPRPLETVLRSVRRA